MRIKGQNVEWWHVQAPRNKQQKNRKLRRTTESIYHARAPEIREDLPAEHLVFQLGGLGDWGEVEIKVLRSIGWNLGCVYKRSLNPDLTKMDTPI